MLETTCTMCHSLEPPEELFEFDEHQLCVRCLEEYTLLCACCGERILHEESCGDDNISLCESCYDRDYTRCTECERVISHHCAYYEDDYNEDAPYCSHCYHEAAHNFAIHSYDYKPYMNFYGEGKQFLGVELEIDCGGENSEHARQILYAANQECEHLYCKHDGSLNSGMELVSHPMTLAYHQDEMPWKAVLQKARELSYLSHQSSTCGLHVHVNRESLGASYQEQNDCIARILYFVESHWLELLRFSRRTESQMNQWAARYGRKDSPKEVFDNAQKCYARYTCVNLTNTDTIEFRMFRGTLKHNTLIATLQLVSEICRVACLWSDREIEKLSWTDFVEQLDMDCYPELITYLMERRLYINELVTIGMEEV